MREKEGSKKREKKREDRNINKKRKERYKT